MKLPLPLIPAVFLCLGPLAQAQQIVPPSAPWAHENSDLKPDSKVTWGLLPSGLRYAILPNTEPPKRVSLRFYVDAGSLMENDDQQGLAHFLEHMAFNGSKHFPAGEMVEYFQRLGMAFGSHTNAHTSFKETVYQLELPDAEDKMLADGFQLVRDYADGLLLGQPEIDKERGVILSEKRSRDSAEWRSFVDWVGFAVPDHRLSKRMPIGQEEVIAKAPRERFTEFYKKWYTSNRMVFAIVGDVDPAKIEGLIHTYFDDLAAPSPAVADPEMGTVKGRGVVAHHHSDPELPETSVSLEVTRPSTLGPDSQARRAREMRIRLADHIVSRRLEVLSKKENSPIIQGRTEFNDLFELNMIDYASIDATCAPEKWKEALAVIEQELRRALQFGFTDAELTEAKANFLNRAKVQAQSAPTRKTSDLADLLISQAGNQRVFTHPTEDLPRVQGVLQAITAAECQQELQKVWGNLENIQVYANGKLKIEGGEATVLAAYNASKQSPVEAPAQSELAKFAYAEDRPAGAIASRKEVEDLKVTQIVFANQVRANFKPTEFEKDRIRITARIGGGQLTEPKGQPGLSTFVSATFAAGGLEAHSADDLQRIFAGKTVNGNFGVSDDAFVLAGQTTPEDLAEELQFLRAMITHPGYREEAERQFKKQIDPIYQSLYYTPQGIMEDKVGNLIHGGDPRFGYPAPAEMAKRSMAEAKSWVGPALQTGFLELSVVGDFDLEKTIELVAKTFGSLPAREAAKPAYTAERKVSFPAERGLKTFTFSSEIPKALALVYWPTADMSDIKKTRRLGLLSAIFRDRLRVKVREELGDAYSPYARNVSSESLTGFGYTFAFMEVAPAQTDKLLGVIKEIGESLAKDGATQDELDRAKLPMLTQIQEYLRTNDYWMESVVSMSQEYPQRLDWARHFVKDYEAMTIEEINALAKEYYGSAKGLSVAIVPEVKAATPAQ